MNQAIDRAAPSAVAAVASRLVSRDEGVPALAEQRLTGVAVLVALDAEAGPPRLTWTRVVALVQGVVPAGEVGWTEVAVADAVADALTTRSAAEGRQRPTLPDLNAAMIDLAPWWNLIPTPLVDNKVWWAGPPDTAPTNLPTIDGHLVLAYSADPHGLPTVTARSPHNIGIRLPVAAALIARMITRLRRSLNPLHNQRPLILKPDHLPTETWNRLTTDLTNLGTPLVPVRVAEVQANRWQPLTNAFPFKPMTAPNAPDERDGHSQRVAIPRANTPDGGAGRPALVRDKGSGVRTAVGYRLGATAEVWRQDFHDGRRVSAPVHGRFVGADQFVQIDPDTGERGVEYFRAGTEWLPRMRGGATTPPQNIPTGPTRHATEDNARALPRGDSERAEGVLDQTSSAEWGQFGPPSSDDLDLDMVTAYDEWATVWLGPDSGVAPDGEPFSAQDPAQTWSDDVGSGGTAAGGDGGMGATGRGGSVPEGDAGGRGSPDRQDGLWQLIRRLHQAEKSTANAFTAWVHEWFDVIDVAPDGDCFYQTILNVLSPEQLAERKIEATAAGLREWLAQHLEADFQLADIGLSLFSDFFAYPEAATPPQRAARRQEWLTLIRTPGSWNHHIGDAVPQILAHALKLPMRVHQMSHSQNIDPQPADPDTVRIHVMLHNNHYQNLTPRHSSAAPNTDWNGLAFTPLSDQTALDAAVNHYRNDLQHRIDTAEQQPTNTARYVLRTKFDDALRAIGETSPSTSVANARRLAAQAAYFIGLRRTKAWSVQDPHPNLTDTYTLTFPISPSGMLTISLGGKRPYVRRPLDRKAVAVRFGLDQNGQPVAVAQFEIEVQEEPGISRVVTYYWELEPRPTQKDFNRLRHYKPHTRHVWLDRDPYPDLINTHVINNKLISVAGLLTFPEKQRRYVGLDQAHKLATIRLGLHENQPVAIVQIHQPGISPVTLYQELKPSPSWGDFNRLSTYSTTYFWTKQDPHPLLTKTNATQRRTDNSGYLSLGKRRYYTGKEYPAQRMTVRFGLDLRGEPVVIARIDDPGISPVTLYQELKPSPSWDEFDKVRAGAHYLTDDDPHPNLTDSYTIVSRLLRSGRLSVGGNQMAFGKAHADKDVTLRLGRDSGGHIVGILQIPIVVEEGGTSRDITHYRVLDPPPTEEYFDKTRLKRSGPSSPAQETKRARRSGGSLPGGPAQMVWVNATGDTTQGQVGQSGQDPATIVPIDAADPVKPAYADMDAAVTQALGLAIAERYPEARQVIASVLEQLDPGRKLDQINALTSMANGFPEYFTAVEVIKEAITQCSAKAT